jgi:hypothetical protein
MRWTFHLPLGSGLSRTNERSCRKLRSVRLADGTEIGGRLLIGYTKSCGLREEMSEGDECGLPRRLTCSTLSAGYLRASSRFFSKYDDDRASAVTPMSTRLIVVVKSKP